MAQKMKTPDKKYADLFDRFYSIQCDKYFEKRGKDGFDTLNESEIVGQIIRTGWNTYIESKKENLLSMKKKDIVNFFDAVDLDFPHLNTEQSERDKEDDDIFINLDDEESFEEDFVDEFRDDDLNGDGGLFGLEDNLLNDEIDSLADELDAIPDEEREDVIMLMLAFPALQEIGFPINVFIAGDGGTHLTDIQRKQIDWARQLAYRIAEMSDEADKRRKKDMREETTTFAKAFIKPDRIERIINEIETVYKRGQGL